MCENSLQHVSSCDWLSRVTWWREHKYAGILYHMQSKMMVVDVLQPKWVSQENGQKEAVTRRLAAVLF